MLQCLKQDEAYESLVVEPLHVAGHALRQLVHDTQCRKGVHASVEEVNVVVAPQLEIIPELSRDRT